MRWTMEKWTRNRYIKDENNEARNGRVQKARNDLYDAKFLWLRNRR